MDVTSAPPGGTPGTVEDPLVMRASWIAAPGAVTGSWLLRRDVDLGTLLADEVTGTPLELLAAELVVATTGDVDAYLGDDLVAEVRSIGPGSAVARRIDLTDHLLGLRRNLVGHASLGLRHVEDGSTAGGAVVAVLGGLVLHVRVPAGSWTDEERRLEVVGTDATWWTTPDDITFRTREEPGRRALEVHEVLDSWTDDDGSDPFDWTRFGAMHSDARRDWTRAVDLGGHPSLVHPDLVVAPELVVEDFATVRGHVLTAGGVQCLDLGGPARSRPVIALPDGARRPVTLWAGPHPGTAPHGGDLQILTHGRAAVLDAHGSVAGRWLHIHGAPDLELGEIAVPVRVGVLPRPLQVDLSDDLLAQVLADGLAGLGVRAQERYLGEDGVPLLGDIARIARAALLVGHDTWRSERALTDFLATARRGPEGTVVDAIAPGDMHVDLDEHTFALAAWVADQRDAGHLPRGAEGVVRGIIGRILARTGHDSAPADRMSTLAAALDALDAADRALRADLTEDDREQIAVARELLVDAARERLRARRGHGVRGAWLDARGDEEGSAEATALAVLAGLVRRDEAAATTHVLRTALEEAARPVVDPDEVEDVEDADAEDAEDAEDAFLAPVDPDPRGLVRAALVRAGDGHRVIARHVPGDDVPPLLLREIVDALSGIEIDGDRIHVRPPRLALDALDLVLPHRRGDIHLDWDGPDGTVEGPPGTHVLVHPEGASEPVWYNSGTAPVSRAHTPRRPR